MSDDRDITILTDIPEWNAPLVDHLGQLGVSVTLVADPAEVSSRGLLLNRVSAKKASEDREFTERVEQFLSEQENGGRQVINGAFCHHLGYDKLAQTALFERCGVRTPVTRPATIPERALPDMAVLLKPLAGSYGKGIIALEPGDSIPETVSEELGGFLEQERVGAIDGSVHRVEVLGGSILYEAVTPLVPGSFDYCLASGDLDTTLTDDLPSPVERAVLAISDEAGMGIGSVEYLLGPDDEPFFIDLNPVSSLHPGAAQQLGFDPPRRFAEWLTALNRR